MWKHRKGRRPLNAGAKGATAAPTLHTGRWESKDREAAGGQAAGSHRGPLLGVGNSLGQSDHWVEGRDPVPLRIAT